MSSTADFGSWMPHTLQVNKKSVDICLLDVDAWVTLFHSEACYWNLEVTFHYLECQTASISSKAFGTDTEELDSK